jgi:hypothetical protein
VPVQVCSGSSSFTEWLKQFPKAVRHEQSNCPTVGDNSEEHRQGWAYLKGFEIAGADQKFKYAKAGIEGNTVVVSSDQVANPVAVHFAWTNNPEDANLFNKNGFPPVPFLLIRGKELLRVESLRLNNK